MARYEMQLPEQIMKDIQMLNDNYEQIFGGMTKAGAEVAMANIEASIPKSIRDSNMMSCLKLTQTYRTPSDDGINTKVGFYGYFINKDGKRVPAPLVANVFEYGRSNAPFPKQPFLRKSFSKGRIEKAMLEAQKRLSGGLLDE
jgi:hypothetical protein